MTTKSNTDSLTITVTDDSFLDVDLIESDELIHSATQLLNEVLGNRQMPAPMTSPRERAMSEVRRFLSQMRESETAANQDDDVVFVEARPGNALPSTARTTAAVVDLCSPADDVPPVTRRRGRRSGAAPLTRQSGVRGGSLETTSIPTKSRRRQPKAEPGGVAAQPVSPTEIVSPPGKGVAPSLICPVCIESVLNHKPSSTSCGHIFCQKCIYQAIQTTSKCPLCNSKLRRNQVHRVYF